ncbi:hypothetical protein [Halalkalicoccus ordinarius]|uniref:hypothetical protein n=1 Tax=Halalkalicoccus ordinarius TaxID=3116651 RepID=UPI00300F7995
MESDLSRDDTTEETFSGLTGRIARWRTNPLDPEQSGTIEYSLYETRAAAADMAIFVLVGLTAYMFSVGAVMAQQEVGGDGCSTITEQAASNGLPMLQRIAFVGCLGVLIVAGLSYAIHKTPGKLEGDINWAKRGFMGLGVALLAPTLIQMVFGDIFGFSFADCVTGGLGVL